MTSGLATERQIDEESSKKNRLRRQLSAWIPVAICVLVIVAESTAAFGADHTSGPLQAFCEWLLHKRFTQPEWWRMHIIIRKCGHLTGYGLLSASWFRAFWMTFRLNDDPRRRWNYAHLLAVLGTFVVASGDELHQLLLPNRTGSFVDVMIDCTGALLMQILIWFSMRNRYVAR